MYAVKANRKWATSLVDSNWIAGKHNAIALDAAGKVHISYHAYTLPTPTQYSALRYATNASGSWVAEEVISSYRSPSIGKYTSIIVDKDKHVHISYYDTGDLSYITNSGGRWRYSSSLHVASGPSGECYSSIMRDSKGFLHIGYCDVSSGTVKHATNMTGPWRIATVDCVGSVGVGNSIAVEPGGKLHISYADDSNGALKYALIKAGTWTTVTVDDLSGPSEGVRETSVAVDRYGKVHIGYIVAEKYNSLWEYAVKYASNASGSWVSEVVANFSLSPFRGISIDADFLGHPHLSYIHTSGQVLYATKASGSWMREKAYPGINVFLDDRLGSTSIRLDSRGKATIAYDNAESVYYATNATGEWVQHFVDSLGGNGGSVSLAIDSSDNLHMSYVYQGTWPEPCFLNYATKSSGSWSFARGLDTWTFIHYGTSLAIDAGNRAHISYYTDDPRRRVLNYATNRSGSWLIEEVEGVWPGTSGNVGKYNSLVLDSGGKAHLSYYSEQFGSLKYATGAFADTDRAGLPVRFEAGFAPAPKDTSMDHDSLQYDIKEDMLKERGGPRGTGPLTAYPDGGMDR